MAFYFRDPVDLSYKKREKIAKNALEHLEKFNGKNCKTLLEDQGAFEAILYLAHDVSSNRSFLPNHGLEEIYCKLLTYINDLSQSDENFKLFEIVVDSKQIPKKNLGINDKCVEIFAMILISIDTICNRNYNYTQNKTSEVTIVYITFFQSLAS
jgi:hypothetical protein